MRLEVLIPGLKIVSTANLREHWTARAARNKDHRKTAWASMLSARAEAPETGKFLVELTRIYPPRGKPMDSDNLSSGFKAVRDGVADWLCMDDGSAKIKWVTSQEQSAAWGVRIVVSIEPK